MDKVKQKLLEQNDRISQLSSNIKEKETFISEDFVTSQSLATQQEDMKKDQMKLQRETQALREEVVERLLGDAHLESTSFKAVALD